MCNQINCMHLKLKRNEGFADVSHKYLYTVLTVEGKSAWSLTTKLSVSRWILALSAV